MNFSYIGKDEFVLQDLNLGASAFRTDVNNYVVLFKANYCHYCILYEPAYNDFAFKFPQSQFLAVESTENTSLINMFKNLINPAFKIDGYPTLIIFDKKGKFIKTVENRNRLDDLLNSL